MKRVYALLLALLLLLTGCTGKVKAKNISVKDGCCPYKIEHKKDTVELTLQDAQKQGLLWNAQSATESICQVTQESVGKNNTYKYHIAPNEEGVDQLTFTAQLEDETVAFVLELMVVVNEDGKTIVTSAEHKERNEVSVDTDTLGYTWNVDTDGILHFSFRNSEDQWSVSGGGDDICSIFDQMRTPSGCQFSAQAQDVGTTSVVLVGENTQRTIHVTIRADKNGQMEVTSVQEQ